MVAYWYIVCGPSFDSWMDVLFSSHESISIADYAILESSLIQKIVGVLDYIFIFFMSVMGAIFTLRKEPVTIETSFALASLILLVFINSNISNLFISLLGYRLPIFVALFVAFISAYGIVFLLDLFDNLKPCGKCIILLSTLSFFFISCVLTGHSTDFSGVNNFLGENSRTYFSESELASFNFFQKHYCNSSDLVSDSISMRYLDSYSNVFHNPVALNYDSNYPLTYLIFREGEYHLDGTLDFYMGVIGGKGFAGAIMETLNFRKSPRPFSSWIKGLKIYDNKETSTYFKEK
jgi:hypothetical protein